LPVNIVLDGRMLILLPRSCHRRVGEATKLPRCIGLGKGDLYGEKTSSDWMGALTPDIRDGTETECVCAVSDAEVEICFHVS
jgi:hypothetical protein